MWLWQDIKTRVRCTDCSAENVKSDVRFFPLDPHPNGYVTFDWEMLISALEHGNDVERNGTGEANQGHGKAGAELVIMQ